MSLTVRQISKFNLDFNMKGQKFPVHQELTDTIMLQSKDEKLIFKFPMMDDPHQPFTLSFSPQTVSVRKVREILPNMEV